MNKPILLVADDEEMSREVIKRFLKKEYEIVSAENGLEALHILETQKVDIALLDIIMPEMNGLELLKRIRENESWKSIGVLVATSVKEKTEREALAIGADDVVEKPYDPTVIKVRLSNIIAKKRLEKLIKNDETNKSCKAFNLVEVSNHLEMIEDSIKIMKDNMDNKDLITELTNKISEHTKALTTVLNQIGGED